MKLIPLFGAVIPLIIGLEIKSSSLEGTETTEGLTDKQLGIQRWFSELTFLNPDNWDGWGESVQDLDCDGNTCIRYEIAGLAYASSLLSQSTPAYTQIIQLTLNSTIQKMFKKEVWQYIELFDDFISQPTYPDPVAYKNIMYSGHLAQVCHRHPLSFPLYSVR